MEMHPKSHGLSHVRPAPFDCLCGSFGGRRNYQDRHGHMSLREIYAHVDIRRQDAEHWLAVMDQAMADAGMAGR
jgi:hemoglobin